MDTAAKTPKLIKSLQRAINILDLFDQHAAQLGVTEIAEALGLHKSTAAGLIYTLEHNGYLDQDPATRKYRLGFKIVERASTLLDQIDVRAIAMSDLQELRDWCDESVNLAVRDGAQIVYVARLTTTQSLGMRATVGYRAPMHCTALGKAILSASDRDDVEQMIEHHGLPAVTSCTVTAPQAFRQELANARAQGFALDNEENEVGVRCIAAPIFDHAARVVAAVSVSAPIHRFPLADVPRFGQRVQETAQAISFKLGYRLLERVP